MRIPGVFFLCLFCYGCQQQYVEVNESRLHQLVDSTYKDHAVGWVYTGTDDTFHYFVRQYALTDALLGPPFGPQCFFKIAKDKMEMEDTFRPAKDERGASIDRLVFRRWIPHRMEDGTIDYDLKLDFYSRCKDQYPPDLEEIMRHKADASSSQPTSAGSP